MYESFFELEGRPFLASPIAERYYPAASAEHARKSALRCIERGGGSTVILGSAGTGKSTLCQVLAQQLQDQFHIATLTSARLCTRRALLQNILFELKQPYRDREEGELRLSLIDYLE
ncbi:MAG: AAA family ATPase, partial [Planctomycetota bacterium]